MGIGIPGRVALMFTREADSARAAIISALANVRDAVHGARLVEATPDFVGLTDVADTVGVSRQNMRKLMTTHAGSFPLPVHEGAASVWHLADILRWLDERGSYDVDPALIEIADTTMQVNLARGAARLLPAMRQELAALVAGPTP
ncbi:helix-turn-helix transcriptional regulator [Cupriavidus agavae]|uniref:helix-turn-helix transcriptional regulator n=1 Tax=Cupriavidus agavae TaxID=1001822 RepID=UPI0018E583FA